MLICTVTCVDIVRVSAAGRNHRPDMCGGAGFLVYTTGEFIKHRRLPENVSVNYRR